MLLVNGKPQPADYATKTGLSGVFKGLGSRLGLNYDPRIHRNRWNPNKPTKWLASHLLQLRVRELGEMTGACQFYQEALRGKTKFSHPPTQEEFRAILSKMTTSEDATQTKIEVMVFYGLNIFAFVSYEGKYVYLLSRISELLDKKHTLELIEKYSKYPQDSAERVLRIEPAKENIKIASLLMEAGYVVDRQSENNSNLAPIHSYAANSVEFFAAIVDKAKELNITINFDIKSKFGSTPFHTAIEASPPRYNNAFRILRSGINFQESTSKKKSPIDCILNGTVEEKDKCLLLIAYLEGGGDVTVKDEKGRPLAVIAVQNKNIRLLEKIKAKSGDLDAPSDENLTPLHYAIQQGDQKIFEWLLANDADIDLADAGGTTPLMMAISRGQVNFVEALLKKNAELNAQNDEEHTALHSAALRDDLSLTTILLQSKADVHVQDKEGRSPLFLAAQNKDKNSPEIIQALCNEKASIDQQNADGITPARNAIIHGQLDNLEMLIANGADINQIDKDGNTLLHAAVLTNNRKMVSAILGANGHNTANIRKKNRNGQTPLSLTVLNHFDQIKVDLQDYENAFGKTDTVVHHFNNPAITDL